MNTLREAATQALEALEGGADSWERVGPAIDALRAALVEDAMQKFTDVSQEIEAALAEPVQKPVAWYCKEGLKRGVSLKQESPEWIPLYTKEKP